MAFLGVRDMRHVYSSYGESMPERHLGEIAVQEGLPDTLEAVERGNTHICQMLFTSVRELQLCGGANLLADFIIKFGSPSLGFNLLKLTENPKEWSEFSYIPISTEKKIALCRMITEKSPCETWGESWPLFLLGVGSIWDIPEAIAILAEKFIALENPQMLWQCIDSRDIWFSFSFPEKNKIVLAMIRLGQEQKFGCIERIAKHHEDVASCLGSTPDSPYSGLTQGTVCAAVQTRQQQIQARNKHWNDFDDLFDLWSKLIAFTDLAAETATLKDKLMAEIIQNLGQKTARYLLAKDKKEVLSKIPPEQLEQIQRIARQTSKPNPSATS